MLVMRKSFYISVENDVANKIYCPNILDDDDDKFLKVILYYNVKAVCYFANPHMTGYVHTEVQCC
jgi:hypothetical protein